MGGHPINRNEQNGLLGQLSAELSGSYRGVKHWFSQFNGKLAPTHGAAGPSTIQNGAMGQNFERLFEELPSGVVVLDEYDVVQSCNRAARVMLGDPLLGMHWEGVAARLALIEQGNDATLVKLDGRLLNLVASGSQDTSEKIIVLSDAADSAEDTAASSSDLAENAMRLAHQVRTPLALASFYAAHLRRNGVQERERHVFADKIGAALQHVEKIVQEILAFSSEPACHQEKIPVDALLKDFHRLAAPALKNGGCALIVNDQTPRALLHGEREALLEALNHLATNAINACGQGGRLRLTVQAAGTDAIDLVLSDNGPGIPEDIQNRIMEPFFSTKHQATGLGLTRVQAIMQAHQGTLWCKSESGKGATFVLHLPAEVPTGAQIISLVERRAAKKTARA